MEATFEFTREDYADLNRIVLDRQLVRQLRRKWPGRRPSWRLLGLLWLVLALLVAIYALLVMTTDGAAGLVAELDAVRRSSVGWFVGVLLGGALLLLLGLLGLLGLVALLRLVTPCAAKQMLSEHGSLLGRHRVCVDEGGVHLETPKARGFYEWRGVVEVADSPRHLLLFVDAAAAIMVPKRAFASEHAARSFLERARELWLDARPAATTPDDAEASRC